MYGPTALPPVIQQSDSDSEVCRPGSKLHIPAAYDSSREDEALNAQIASR